MKVRNLLLSTAICLLGATVARAGSLGTVNVRYKNTSPAGFATIHRPGYSSDITVWTGQYNLELDPSYSPADPADESNLIYEMAGAGRIIGTFCSDVREDAPTGAAFVPYEIIMPEDGPYNDADSPMGQAKADDLRRLFGTYGGIWQDGLGIESEDAAAFALCVWEIIFETAADYDVYSGAFYSTGTWTTNWAATTVRSTANTWLDAVQAAIEVPDIPLRILANDGRQDYAIVVPGGGTNPPHAPEPLTVLGLLLGAGGLAGYLRKRKAV